LQFRHVGTTEEYLDKSQEIRVKAWTSGQNVNFEVGERVIHPHRRPGTVSIVMPDQRRVVKYDSGEVFWYMPGKAQWKYRLAKHDTDCQPFCCCAPIIQTTSVNEYLRCGPKDLKPGDRVCQNNRGTGTIIRYTVDKKMEVEYDERGAEPTCTALIAPGNDPKMFKITSFSLCPCSSWFVDEPSSLGAIDGHAADEQSEQDHLQREMQKQAQQEFDFEIADDEAPLAPEVQPDKASKSWFGKAEPHQFQSEGEVQNAITLASLKENYEEAARLKRILLEFQSRDLSTDPSKKREQLKEQLETAKYAQDFDKAASLKNAIKILNETIDTENKRSAETFSPEKLGADEGAASAFLDEMLQQNQDESTPAPKSKLKKPKQIDPETGEVVKKKKPKEIDPETGEVIKKKKTEIDPETGEEVVVKKKKKKTTIDPETGDEVVVKKKKKKKADDEGLASPATEESESLREDDLILD